MTGEPFDRKRIHHWHLGIIGAVISFVIALMKLGFANVISANTWTIAGCCFAYWALDDALYHRYGLCLLFYWVEQGLRKIKTYRDISDWVKGKIK